MHGTSSASEAVRDEATAHASSELSYCQPRRHLLSKTQILEKAAQSKPLSRDFLGLSATVDFVVVVCSAGMPLRRVFRHAWRDSSWLGLPISDFDC
jgi:hypothetical protein